MLKPCPRCYEKSVTVRVYEDHGIIKRVEYCVNKGCCYQLTLPPIIRKKGGVEWEHSQSVLL